MTIQEVAEKYGVSETSLKGAFPRTQKSILKKWGVHIIKVGRGAAASYEIQEDYADGRALTLYEEVKDDINISVDTMNLLT